MFFLPSVLIRSLLLGPVLNQPNSSPSLSQTVLVSFQIILQDLMDFIRKMKQSSCPLDVLLSPLFLKVLTTIGPAVSAIVNSTLSKVRVPSDFKHAPSSLTVLWCPAGLRFGVFVTLLRFAALGKDHKQF